MLIISLLLVFNLLIALHESDFVQYIFIIVFPLMYTIYPVLNIYINSIVNEEQKLKISFPPFILSSVIFLVLLGFRIAFKEDFVTTISILNTYGVNLSPKLKPIIWIMSVLYYLQFFYYLFSFLRRYKELKIVQNSFRAVWVKYIITGMVMYELLFFLTLIFNSHASLTDVFFCDLGILILGLIGFKHDELLLELQISKSFENNPMLSSERKIKSKFSEGKKHEIISELQNMIKNEKLYLNPNLKIKNFAKRLHLPEKDLSIIINDSIGKNFSSFINEYRINAACLLLSDTNVKISDIPSQVGFFSRSAFNKIFKEIMRKTPSEYRKSA